MAKNIYKKPIISFFYFDISDAIKTSFIQEDFFLEEGINPWEDEEK